MPKILASKSVLLKMHQSYECIGDAENIAFIIPEQAVTAETDVDTWRYQFEILMPEDFCFYYSLDDYKGERPKITLRELLVAGRQYYLDHGAKPDALYQIVKSEHTHIIDIHCPTVASINTFNDALPPALPEASGDAGVEERPFAGVTSESKHPESKVSESKESKRGESKYGESKHSACEAKHSGSRHYRSSLMPSAQHRHGDKGLSMHRVPAGSADIRSIRYGK